MAAVVVAVAVPVTFARIAAKKWKMEMTKKQTIYLDTIHGLQAVKFMGYAESPCFDVTQCYDAVVQIKRSRDGAIYHSGEILHVPPSRVVEKSHVRNYHQYVKPAVLPERTEANTTKSRW